MEEILQQILGKITGIDDKITVIDARLTGLEDRMTGMEDRMTGLEDRMTGMEDRMTVIENRIEHIEEDLSEVKQLATKTAITVENDVAKKIAVLYDYHEDSVRHFDEQIKLTQTVEVLQHDVSALKIIVSNKKAI